MPWSDHPFSERVLSRCVRTAAVRAALLALTILLALVDRYGDLLRVRPCSRAGGAGRHKNMIIPLPPGAAPRATNKIR